MTTRATPGIHALTVAATLAAVLSAGGMALAQSGEPSPAAEVSPPQMAPLEGEPATGSAANPLTGTATRLEALADDQEPLPSPVGTRPPLPLPVEGETIDYAYGAFQRGWYLTALSLATPRAEEGDTAAQTLLGVLYETGRGLPQDAEKAASWYSLAAANGNVKAALRYGLLLLNGIGVAEDRQKAGDMFQIAADADVPEAIYNLAGLYRTGEGRPYDPDTALELLQKAAELDDVDAQFELAQFRLDGPADVRDEARAAFWMGRAARQGHVGAQVRYGILRFNGRGVDPNEPEAADWFERAATSGNPVAMNRLARVYAYGRGRDVDLEKAAGWHLAARGLGVSDLQLDGILAGLDPDALAAAEAFAKDYVADPTAAPEGGPIP